jgi:hypothetical protein
VPAPLRALGGGGDDGDSGGGGGGGMNVNALLGVGGLAEAKAALDEALSLPLRHAAVFANAPLRLRTGVLLYG